MKAGKENNNNKKTEKQRERKRERESVCEKGEKLREKIYCINKHFRLIGITWWFSVWENQPPDVYDALQLNFPKGYRNNVRIIMYTCVYMVKKVE